MTDNHLDAAKTRLGKLLASENIRIEHRNISGPAFDVVNRTLVLPMWKYTNADLYDLMIGHEVGHALYTPSSGWLEKADKLGPKYKMFLNLIEDVRIEKKMKRRYPGLRQPMYNGYSTLVERDFFGVTWDEMNDLPFADRLNVHFKLGARAMIKFTKDEAPLLGRIANAETFEEVMVLAEELYDKAAQEMDKIGRTLKNMADIGENQDGSPAGSKVDSDDSDESSQSSSGFGDEESDEDSDNGRNSSSGSDDSDDDSDGDDDDTEGDSKLDEKENKSNSQPNQDRPDRPGSKPMSDRMRDKLQEYVDNEDPTSLTQEAFEDKQEELVDRNVWPFFYAKLPILDLSKWVIPAKVVHAIMEPQFESLVKRDTLYNDFMTANRRYISYMVKEFELRRNARQFAKAKISKTGDLDINKILKYKLSDDLFLQSTVVPNGKNHGMLMMVDLSGSMAGNMKGTLDQIISLSMFCRKVNIPFEVYGFIDNGSYGEEFDAVGIPVPQDLHSRNDTRQGVLSIRYNAIRLKQFVHWKMGAAEFTNSVKNLILLADNFARRNRGYGSGSYYAREYVKVPSSMELGGTPLDEAIIILRNIAEKFKEQTHVEILNTIILTDGQGSRRLGVYEANGHEGGIPYQHRVVIEDERSHTSTQLDRHGWYEDTLGLLDLYKKATGSRVIGFFLSPKSYCTKSRLVNQAVHAGMNYSKAERQYKEEYMTHKFFGLKQPGYDVYYILPGDNLVVDDLNMDTFYKPTGLAPTKGNLFKAFQKLQSAKSVSQVFLNRFVREIA